MADKSGAIGTVGAALGGATSFTGLGGLAGIGMMLGGMFGGGDDGGSSTKDLQDQINAILNQGLNQALNYSQNYTGQAVDQQNQSLQAAVDALTGYSNKAQQAAQNAVNQGFSQSQRLRAPYASAGYDALDAYKKTLGLATPEGGTVNFLQNQQTALDMAPQLQSLLKSMNGNYNTMVAPTTPNYTSANSIDIKSPEVQKAIIDSIYQTGTGAQFSQMGAGPIAFQNALSQFVNPQTGLADINKLTANTNSGVNHDIIDQYNNFANQYRQNQANMINSPLQQQYDQQNQAYQQHNQAYNQLGSLLGNAGGNQQLMQMLAQNLRGKI